MTCFQILVHGQNLMLLDGSSPPEKQVGGVYVWRGVEAESEAEALEIAVDRLVKEPEFQEHIWNSPHQVPSFLAEEVRVLEPGASSDLELDGGYVFYIEAEE